MGDDGQYGRDPSQLHDRPTVVPDQTVHRAVPAPPGPPPFVAGVPDPAVPEHPSVTFVGNGRSLWWIPVGILAIGLLAVGVLFVVMQARDDESATTTTIERVTTSAPTTASPPTTEPAPSSLPTVAPTTTTEVPVTVPATVPPTTATAVSGVEQAATQALASYEAGDRDAVLAAVGSWMPQLSSKADGMTVKDRPDGPVVFTERDVLSDHEKYRSEYAPDGGVVLVSSDDYNFKTPGLWVTLLNRSFASADEANAWCDAKGLDKDNCFAKRIETGGSHEGTVVHRR